MKSFHMTSGKGCGEYELTAFDSALLASGVANYNLVKISSILPPACEERARIELPEGSVLHTAYAALVSSDAGQAIAAAVSVAIPEDCTRVGVIMEYSDRCTKDVAVARVEKMVREAMKNRDCPIKEIKTVASEAIVADGEFCAVFASLSIF